MIGCYHNDVHFSDPVFTDLHGNRAKAMWHMLCRRGHDLQVMFDNVQADGNDGQAHWEATYTFSTDRKVHNVIEARFVFAEGKIIEHEDDFDLWRWTRMALGPLGWFLGGIHDYTKKCEERPLPASTTSSANTPNTPTHEQHRFTAKGMGTRKHY